MVVFSTVKLGGRAPKGTRLRSSKISVHLRESAVKPIDHW